jgi:hypothetical protein
VGIGAAKAAEGVNKGELERFRRNQRGMRLRRNTEGGFEEVGEH